MREGDQVTTPLPPPPGGIDNLGRQSAESDLRKGNGKIRQNLDGHTHGSGARCSVGRRRKNRLIGGIEKENYWVELG